MRTAFGELRTLIQLSFLTVIVGVLAANAIAEDPPSHLQQVITANSLDQAGKTPFHIKIAYKVFSIDEGNPIDSGFLEEWWASSGQSLVTVTSLAAKIPYPVTFDDSTALDLRERYLLHKLLESELHPVPMVPGSSASGLTEAPRSFGKLKLTCLNFPPRTPIANRSLPLSFCVDQQTAAVRTQYEGEEGSVTHNSLGNFHGTFVPVDLEMSFFNRAAINGKVVGLEVFDSSKSAVTLTSASTDSSNPQEVCTPGEPLRKVQPVYPIAAKANHVSGSVVLYGVVSNQGTIKDVATLASSSIFLTQAGIDAFKQWTYKPCLLNGQPHENEMTVGIHFNFGGPQTAGAPLRTTP